MTEWCPLIWAFGEVGYQGWSTQWNRDSCLMARMQKRRGEYWGATIPFQSIFMMTQSLGLISYSSTTFQWYVSVETQPPTNEPLWEI